jgi:iron complex transport system ATP-binding protein
MLKVENLTIGYGDRTLVRDISFEMAPGECVLLAGANGTGKTTLLKRLAGMSREIPSSVSDLLGMAKDHHSERSEGIFCRTILIPTNIPKVKGFTVEGFIETGCYRESDWRGRISKEFAMKRDEALDVLGIQELKGRDISTLSDGEFKKACLAVGLTRQAKVLLLDEPTAFLDVENRISVLRTLREVARKTGTAILFSSHDLQDTLPVVDRVFVLTRDGRFLASGPDDKEAVLKEAFPTL